MSSYKEFEHKLHYIYWAKEREFKIVSNEELATKITEIKKTRSQIAYSTKRELFDENTFALRKIGDILALYYWDQKYYVYSTDTFDDSNNEEEVRGSEAIRLVINKFKELNNVSFKKAFNTVDEKFKRCIPKQISFVNQNFKGKALKMSSIDICSSFPANIRGKLPDAHTAVGSPGLHKPTKEYPFAFYINSGHFAEYCDDLETAIDTHDWCGLQYAVYLFRSSKELWNFTPCKDEDEYTVLMKASDYELTDVYNYFYNIKENYDHESKEYKDAKLVMNASIGMLHQQAYKNYKYAHIAAVAIARANHQLIKMIEKIEYNNIVQVQVDGILYRGLAYGTNNRDLGSFHQEFENCLGKLTSLGKYIIMQDNKVIKAKWQGCNFNRKTLSKIIIDDIKSLDDQYNWTRINNLEEYLNETVNSKTKGN